MSVNPGFSGQSFIPYVLKKAEQVHKMRQQHNWDFRLEIDGGVTVNNIKSIINAGVDTVVMGSAFFKADNYHKVVSDIKTALST